MKPPIQITDTPDSSVAALTVTVNGLAQSSRSTHNLTTAYAYDALGRQTAVQDARGAVHSRGYDGFGRVAWESDPATNGTWYAYDALGRRTAATNALGQVTYTANALNQYTAIANPDAVGLRGDATNTAVTVNGEAVQSDNIASDTIPWHFALEADNGSGPDFPFAEIVAVVNPPGTNTPDIVSTAGGHLYAPPQNETLTYDDDGNLTSDGRWHYTWNGENRLIKAEELVSPTNRQPCTVEYAYDHQGRMVWKQVATNAVILSTRTLLWDGYNIIRETINHQPSTTNYYVWGLDLSGTLQGAGGVGGLLAEIKDGVPYFAASDANGNVTEYISADGTLAAHYEYSPFGEIVVQSGDLADSFTHRFSTKPWCGVTGLSEYEKRKYRPGLGRWLSRDPMGESIFFHANGRLPDAGEQLNLFLFCMNASMSNVDYLGFSIEWKYEYEIGCNSSWFDWATVDH